MTFFYCSLPRVLQTAVRWCFCGWRETLLKRSTSYRDNHPFNFRSAVRCRQLSIQPSSRKQSFTDLLQADARALMSFSKNFLSFNHLNCPFQQIGVASNCPFSSSLHIVLFIECLTFDVNQLQTFYTFYYNNVSI